MATLLNLFATLVARVHPGVDQPMRQLPARAPRKAGDMCNVTYRVRRGRRP